MQPKLINFKKREQGEFKELEDVQYNWNEEIKGEEGWRSWEDQVSQELLRLYPKGKGSY